VVAADQVNRSAVQAAEDGCSSIRSTTIREIAEVPHFVVRAHGRVPSLDHEAVHLVAIPKWTVTEGDDVRVAEMVASCEPERQGTLPKDRRRHRDRPIEYQIF